MKTSEIMNVYEYDALGGPIQTVPVSDVIQFCQRIEDRLDDIENGMPIRLFAEEIKKVMQQLNTK